MEKIFVSLPFVERILVGDSGGVTKNYHFAWYYICYCAVCGMFSIPSNLFLCV